MSASYWDSSQRKNWQFTREELHRVRNKTLQMEKMCYNSTMKNNICKYDINLRIYLHHLIIKLGRKLNLRQVILATAEVYLTRFLIKASIREVNLYLLVSTCVYIACKIEESPQHIRTILTESRACWPEFIPNDLTKLAEFEFYLIEELDCFMIIHHPYNSLIAISNVLKNVGITAGNHAESALKNKLELTPQELQSAWSIINDSYITDLHLLFPPHIIAIAALHLTLILGMDKSSFTQEEDSYSLSLKNNSKKYMNKFTRGGTSSEKKDTNKEPLNRRIDAFVEFLAGSNVDLDEVIESVQEMLTLYGGWHNYDEVSVRHMVHHLLLGLNNVG